MCGSQLPPPRFEGDGGKADGGETYRFGVGFVAFGQNESPLVGGRNRKFRVLRVCSRFKSPCKKRKKSRQRPTLPRSHPRSTIGARELNFRVRDGIGWDLSAIVTGKTLKREKLRKGKGLEVSIVYEKRSCSPCLVCVHASKGWGGAKPND